MNDKLIESQQEFVEWLKENGMYNPYTPSGKMQAGFEVWEKLITPAHETVEQWEERTGETYPDDGPVWMEIYNCNGLNGGLTLHLVTWNIARQSEPLITPRIIVATHHGKPETK